jgi:hypothetical protein
MNGSEVLQKIDRLIDEGNMVWENPSSNAKRDISRFCGAVKDLVHDIYGDDHPYIKKHTAENEAMSCDLGAGMSVLKNLRMEVESSSQLGH